MFITSASLSPILAQSNRGNDSRLTPRVELVDQKTTEATEKKAEVAKNKVTLKKDNAAKEIDRRIASLEKLIDKNGLMKRIDEKSKTALNGQIQLEIDSLTKLKASILAETDSTKLALLKKSIVDSYRVYALFVPKMTIIAHADQIIQTAALMRLKATSTEAQTNIDSASAKATSAIKTVIELLPSGYPANKADLESARTMLKDALKDLNLARPMLAKDKK